MGGGGGGVNTYFLALQDVLDSARTFPAPVLESTIYPRSRGFLLSEDGTRNQDLALGVLVATGVSFRASRLTKNCMCKY